MSRMQTLAQRRVTMAQYLRHGVARRDGNDQLAAHGLEYFRCRDIFRRARQADAGRLG